MSAADVIAEALAAHEMGDWLEVAPDRYRRHCTCGEFLALDATDNAASFREHQAAVVIASFGDMSPLHQAEVLGRGLEKFHDRNDPRLDHAMKGKRDARRARRAEVEQYHFAPTDPAECTCGHDGLARAWHLNGCPVSRPRP